MQENKFCTHMIRVKIYHSNMYNIICWYHAKDSTIQFYSCHIHDHIMYLSFHGNQMDEVDLVNIQFENIFF